MVYGPSGVGKTTAAIQFKDAYIIDGERGTDFYSDTINKSNSAVMQTNSVDDIMEELKTLLTTKHNYRTLCRPDNSSLQRLPGEMDSRF